MDMKLMGTEDKINLILELQCKGLNRREIAKELTYTRVDTLDRFMKKHNYTKDKENKYIKDVNRIVIQKEDKYSSVTLNIEDDKKIKLLNLIDNYDSIMDLLNHNYKEDNCPPKVIEIKQGFDIDYIKSSVCKTTIRVDKEVYSKFSEICTSKYGHLKKYDIISQLLSDFIENN